MADTRPLGPRSGQPGSNLPTALSPNITAPRSTGRTPPGPPAQSPAKTRGPRLTLTWKIFLGTALESAGESDAALVEYQELAKLDPQSAIGQVGLGALLVKQGKTEEAIAALQKAIALDPKIFEAHWALGRALILAGRFDEAIEALQRAVALAPERSDAHYQLGLALRRAGRTDEAATEFATVERLNAEFRARTK